MPVSAAGDQDDWVVHLILAYLVPYRQSMEGDLAHGLREPTNPQDTLLRMLMYASLAPGKKTL